MNAYRTINLRFVFIALILICIWGCTAKPFDPPQTGEIPKGPGIFSKGDDGVVLYDSNKNKFDRQVPITKDPTAKDDTGQPVIPAPASDYAEFEAYQQFKAWKKSAVGTQEYEQFQQWREWRQYQQWKKRKN